MDRLNKILPYIIQNKCAFFVGAGLSKTAGCYDWYSVIQKMFEHPLIKSKGIEKDELLRNARYEELIDYCQQLFLEGGLEHHFWGIARKAITFNPELFYKNYLPLIKMLNQINPLPKIILTTNIDNCLEHTNEYDLSDVYFKTDDFTEQKLNGSGIFHIHGYIEEFEKSLLTRRKYISRYKEKRFQAFLKSFFIKHSVLFLGYSLRDQEIKDVILETKDDDRMHFLLLPEEDGLTPSQISLYYDMYRIVTVIYGRKDNFYNQLNEWVDKNFKATSLKTREVDKPYE
jgi:NAD-dependent SIR2 family protein deacetylase